MASTDKIAPSLPDTLPEDFSEWDREASALAAPGNSAGSKSDQAFETPKPPGTAEREAILASVLDRARDPHSSSSAPVFAKQKQKQKEFIDWAGETSSAAAPGNSGRSNGAHLPGVAAKPLGQSAEREAILAPARDGSRELRPGSSVQDSFKLQKLSTSMVDKSPTSPKPEASHKTYEYPVSPTWPSVATVDGMRDIPEFDASAKHEAAGALFESFALKTEPEGEQKTGRKKWMIIAAVSACSILLLLLMIPVFHHGTKPVVKESALTSPAANVTQPEVNTPESSPMQPLTQDKSLAMNKSQQTTDNGPAKEEVGVNSARVQSQMMNDQLSAPSRISQDIKKGADDAPPPVNFGTAGLGGSGADVSVFNGHAQPIVNASSKPILVSAGVATGMLIQKTIPAYPLIAKEARVSGTVEMRATISTTGTIKDLQVLNGPAMLRKPALDAVRTWRYKPYKLNNEPTEVETTINVVFNLGG